MVNEKYFQAQDKKDFANRFSESQKMQLSQRGILIDDAFYLLKDFYQIDTMLAQPDSVLKKKIESYYQFFIDATVARSTTN